VEEFFSENGRLSKILDNYQVRPGQLKMSAAIDNLLNDEQVDENDLSQLLVVEAETGIGKTLAYLLPAVISGKRVVVSTATKNLQDQILFKEIPLIEKLFEAKVSAEVVKGRQNYLCLYKWHQYRSAAQFSMLDKGEEQLITEWLEETETGERSELDWLSDNSQLWYKIAAQSDNCLGSDCPEHAGCFIARLRMRAANAKILIVNHHLFFSDLSLRKTGFGEILPRYEAVVFDEAHHIENIATTFFGKSFSHYQVLDLLGDCERLAEIDLPSGLLKKMRSRAKGLKERLTVFVSRFPGKRGRYPLKPFAEELGIEKWQEEVELLSLGLKEFATQLEEYRAYGEMWFMFSRRAMELHDTLLSVGLSFLESESDHFVHWYDRKEKSVVLMATPVSVADELNTHLYLETGCTVMTSATLTIGGKFDYLQERLGLPEETQFLRFESPFNYRDKSLLYVPENGFPEINQPDYSRKSGEKVLEILQYSRGRALVLFTSFQAMGKMAELLEDRLDYPLLVQGRHSRKYLLEKFKEETDSVLLAVASFWEGIDVAGESLSCVIVDKLPFEVPTDPVIQARMERIVEGGGNPFMEFQVPRAVLTLRQGVGRLMRSAGDSGVIVVLDVRLFSKFYGKRFLESLPPAPVTRKIEDIKNWFSH